MQNTTTQNNTVTQFALFEHEEWDNFEQEWDCKTTQLTDWSSTKTDYTFLNDVDVDDIDCDYDIVGVTGFFDSVDSVDDYDRGTTTTFVAVRTVTLDK